MKRFLIAAAMCLLAMPASAKDRGMAGLTCIDSQGSNLYVAIDKTNGGAVIIINGQNHPGHYIYRKGWGLMVTTVDGFLFGLNDNYQQAKITRNNAQVPLACGSMTML